jgi:hypothetical protein
LKCCDPPVTLWKALYRITKETIALYPRKPSMAGAAFNFDNFFQSIDVDPSYRDELLRYLRSELLTTEASLRGTDVATLNLPIGVKGALRIAIQNLPTLTAEETSKKSWLCILII